MTAYVATVTDSCAWLTQDKGIYDTRDGSLMQETIKGFALPDLGLVVGGAGRLQGMELWPRWLDDFASGDAAGLPKLVPPYLQEFAKHGAFGDEPAQVVHVAFSQEEGRAVGHLFERASDFEPQPFKGTLYMPTLCPEAPGYGALVRRWDGAQRGQGVQELHELVLANQLWGMENDSYRPLKGVSRGYATFIVDADGPRIAHQGTAPHVRDAQPRGLIA